MLDGKAVTEALETLERFAILIKQMRIQDIRPVATAAVRDAQNGREFIKSVEHRSGFKIRILSGQEEARYSAMGVLAGLPEADGLVGDMGGGSMELIHISKGRINENVSLPLGPFLLAEHNKKGKRELVARIDEIIQDVPWGLVGRDRDFYSVGGAWRAIARLHIEQTQYPLHILHNYSIPRDDVIALCDVVSGLSPASLARLPGIAAKRAETLPIAATVLHRIFTIIRPRRLVVSALGLREGILYDSMSRTVKNRDPLLEACHEIAALSGRFPEHANALLQWIDPLFIGEPLPDRRVRLAICMLSDVAWRGHPDYRAEKVLMEVLYGRFGGIDHRGSVLMALSLYVCYGGSLGHAEIAEIERLLPPEDIERVKLIGLALRLAQRFSGGTSSALKLGRLVLDQDVLTLRLKPAAHSLGGEVVLRRLESVARALGRRAAIIDE